MKYTHNIVTEDYFNQHTARVMNSLSTGQYLTIKRPGKPPAQVFIGELEITPEQEAVYMKDIEEVKNDPHAPKFTSAKEMSDYILSNAD